MKILMTGSGGYLGRVMSRYLVADGNEVVGLDTFYYEGCEFGLADDSTAGSSLRLDVRDVTPGHLRGFDAVVHLAALSNDPLGNLREEVTYEINHEASVALARAAKEADVTRFLLASSCSLYGISSNGGLLTEEASFNPITPYGESKVLVERDVSRLASDDFSPTYMRNATVYGVSPALRTDVVVNNLVGLACATGEVRLTSDGSPWRPLVHVEDVARAFGAVLEAPRELVHDEAFNVGSSEENYQVRDLAELTARRVPGATVSVPDSAGPDPRDYRVDCSKLAETLPSARPRWTVPEGIEQLRDAFETHGLTEEELESRYVRLQQIRRLLGESRLDESLRWSHERAGAERG